MSDVPLFELPVPAPLPRPVHPLEAVGTPRYSPYRPKRPVRCEDCLSVALEANKAGSSAPLCRQARFLRTQGPLRLPLCVEHKQGRQDDELTALVVAARPPGRGS